ncbi:MAG: hypothetical protein LBG83_03220 [Oscillospiraceae bacterium]|jgi:predicted transcriptional regulator of viral defense system|nr:hypothetical protein [Oscillospiraceae bacterium]
MNESKRSFIASLEQNSPIVQTELLRKNGLTSREIKVLADANVMRRLRQGYYVFASREAEIGDLPLIAALVPMGVFCLQTAIAYHELATVNPAEINVALPRIANEPTLPEHLNARYFHMTDSHYQLGVSAVMIDGCPVKLYDAEKTVCDCFKYDREVEKSVALEALKNYVARHRNIQKLMDYAKRMGKRNTIQPYLETML